jgi:hypothetical protein
VVGLSAESEMDVKVEDGVLTGSALAWSAQLGSQAFGSLGTGNELIARLYFPCQGGTYTVRLIATDSDGNRSPAALRRVSLFAPC